MKLSLFAKVYQNVYKYQLTEYAKSRGSTFGELSDVERKSIEEAMLKNNYPGKEIIRPRPLTLLHLLHWL